MARVTQLVCDKCGAAEDVDTFTITSAAGRARVDLCPRHARPILDAIGEAASTGRQPRKVYDLDDEGNPVL